MPDELELIPHSSTRWGRIAAQEGVAGKSIHDVELDSASKIQLPQFLLLRVLWKEIDLKYFRSDRFGLGQWMEKAIRMLEDYDSWKEYRNKFDDTRVEGNFFLAKLFQIEAATARGTDDEVDVIASPISKRTRTKTQQNLDPLATPSKSNQPALDQRVLIEGIEGLSLPPSERRLAESPDCEPPSTGRSHGPPELWHEMYPKSEDEQIVNAALVNFLKAITCSFRSVKSDWTMHRKAFKAEFTTTQYEARTDGYLRGERSDDVRALIEVKSSLRGNKVLPFRMQESAQMVAWIKDSPSLPHRWVQSTTPCAVFPCDLLALTFLFLRQTRPCFTGSTGDFCDLCRVRPE